MVSVFTENPNDTEMWVEAIDAKYKGVGKPYGREEWDKLLGHCMVVTPFHCLFGTVLKASRL
jgi:hypothetical protein